MHNRPESFSESPTAPATGPCDEVQALLDAAVDGLVLIDHLGCIQSFSRSAERLFGYRAQEVLGLNVNMLMTDQDRVAHGDYLSRYISTRLPHIIGTGRAVSARRKDASVFPAFLSVGVVAGTEPPRFVGFIQDRTLQSRAGEDARRLQERLGHVSRLATVGETTSAIAHELNQPLAAIANYAQASERMLGQPGAELEEIRAALREITGQAVRAGDIIRRLRGLARPHRGPCLPADINTLVSELTDLVKADAIAHHVRYRLELGEGLPQLELHGTQIQQVILNLVRNALEALREAPDQDRELIVRTLRADDGDVELSVCDTGPGVPANLISQLFEPFCSSKPDGTGLGLAISRTIVGQHQGTLSYRANVPRGACFLLRLPTRGSNA
jgi:two-component system sensor kinase FixL